MSRPAWTATFCTPHHHVAEGPTDPSNTHLPPGFVVVVAGASEGIGLGVAKAYVTAGASGIVLCSRSLEKIEAAAEQVRAVRPECKVLATRCDTTVESDVAALAKLTSDTFGRLDVLVISAGTGPQLSETRENGLRDWPKNFIESTPAELERQWRINVLGPNNLQHHFLPLLESSKSGAQAIVLLASVAGHFTDTDLMEPSYSLTKMAAIRSAELCHSAHHRNGIVTYALQPGGVKTEFGRNVPEGKGWEDRLIDDVGLCGGFAVWLTREKRNWLSGRYLHVNWDVDALLGLQSKIEEDDDLLRLRLHV